MILALFVVAGFLYFTNFADDSSDSEDIIISVTAHILNDPEDLISSKRDEKNILELFESVNEIWSQARIKVEVKEVIIDNVASDIISKIYGREGEISSLLRSFDEESFNAVFASNIDVNGVAFVGLDFFMVNDRTTVHDFRAASHEIGHLLGLQHVPERNMLMFQGSNGMLLSEEEIEFARQNARFN